MKTELLNPQNSALILIDFQPQMTFGVANIDRQTLFNNVILLAKAAKIFNVPTILTTVETRSFSGNMWPQLLDIFPDQKPVERSSMNSLEDAKLVEAAHMQPDQPEVHLKPNKLVKYSHVAAVMADAQRLGVKKLGLVGNEQFLE